MLKTKQTSSYSRSIKLGAAVGDWTKIKLPDSDFEDVCISTVQSSNFNSLPKEKLKYAHYLHYRLAEKVAKQFSQDMDIKVELHSIGAVQFSYEEFIQTQLNPVIQTNLLVNGFGKVAVIFDWGLADSIVNRLMGGNGESSESSSFSEIEQQILQAQVEHIIPSFSEAWKSVFTEDQVSMELMCGPYVQDPKFSLRESYVVFSYSLYLGKGELKKIIWAYPSEVLRKLLAAKQSLEDPIKKRILLKKNTMRNTKIPVKAVLGRASLTMKELKNLQHGDIIPLDTFLQSPLELIVGEKVKLSAQAGVINQRLCMQLIFLDEESPELPVKHEKEINTPPRVEDPLPLEPFLNSVSQPEVEIADHVEPMQDTDWDDLPSEFQPQTEAMNKTSFFEGPVVQAADREPERYIQEPESEQDEPQDELDEDNSFEDDDHHEEELDLEEADSKTTEKKEEDEFSWDDLDTSF